MVKKAVKKTKRERIEKPVSYFAKPKDNIDFIRTGSQMLDLALGGGWAQDRISNIIGDKSTGKTLLCIEASANFALAYPKGKIRYRESEAAFDNGYANALGMPVDRIDFGDPLETVEDLFEDLTKIVAGARQRELVFVDSLDALSDRSEMSREIDEASYGANKAKQMSQLFRRLTKKMADKHVTLIIVSQVRDKIGAMFGDKHTRTGGRALDFYASQIAMLANLGRIPPKVVNGTKRVVGVKVLAKVQKNKVALPFREAEFSINFGYGINDAQSCIDFLKQTKHFKARDFGLSEDEGKNVLNTLLDMDASEAEGIVKQLHESVTDTWYTIEKKLLPTRAKYASA